MTRTLPAEGARTPAMISTSFALSVTVKPCEAQDFAGRQRDVDAIERAAPVAIERDLLDYPAQSLHHHRDSRQAHQMARRGTLISPIIRRASSASPVSAARHSATTRPWRSTVMRSATAIASASLCVTRMTMRPSPRKPAEHLQEGAEFRRREHAGRLIEDQDARVETHRRRISRRTRSPMEAAFDSEFREGADRSRAALRAGRAQAAALAKSLREDSSAEAAER